MGNMSYCRFENTSRDMEDCIESLRDKGINDLEKNASRYEKPFIRAFIRQCIEVAEEFGDEVDGVEEEEDDEDM